MNAGKIAKAIELVSKSSVARHAAVNFMAGYVIGKIAEDMLEDKDESLTTFAGRFLMTTAAVLAIDYAVNKTFDTILEDADNDIYEEFNALTK